MEKVIFILHTYSVGGAERRCVSVANYLALHGVEVKIVLLDVNKMYCCKRKNNDLEVDIGFVDAPAVKIPVNKQVKLVYPLHKNEMPLKDKDITCVAYDENLLPPKNADDYIKHPSSEQEKIAKRQLKQLEEIYINRIYQCLKSYPDYKVVSWMTFCNIATAVALYSLPNDFAFAECTAPDIEFPKESGFNYLKEMFYPRANAAFFQTEEMKRYYTYLPYIKAYVIPNPILADLPNPNTGKRNKNIVNFCRVEKPKNLELLIDTFALLHKKYPDYRLHIYGDGSQKEKLKAMVKQMGLENEVIFFDFTANVHEKVLNDAIFVSTSNREGISNSMLEAMAIGLPVVCTDCYGGGAKAMIEDGKNGLLVPMEDKLALLEAIEKIVKSPKLSEKLSKNAIEIKKILSVSNIGKMWEEAIKADWK